MHKSYNEWLASNEATDFRQAMTNNQAMPEAVKGATFEAIFRVTQLAWNNYQARAHRLEMAQAG